MLKILRITLVVLLTAGFLISCGDVNRRVDEKIDKLLKKTESLDSLLNQEIDKVLTLDSLIDKEHQKVIKLDSLIHNYKPIKYYKNEMSKLQRCKSGYGRP
jgi:enoyl-[acyl-carrier-protein] reductase (NADH)